MNNAQVDFIRQNAQEFLSLARNPAAYELRKPTLRPGAIKAINAIAFVNAQKRATDYQIAAHLEITLQSVGFLMRALAAGGVITRKKGVEGYDRRMVVNAIAAIKKRLKSPLTKLVGCPTIYSRGKKRGRKGNDSCNQEQV